MLWGVDLFSGRKGFLSFDSKGSTSLYGALCTANSYLEILNACLEGHCADNGIEFKRITFSPRLLISSFAQTSPGRESIGLKLADQFLGMSDEEFCREVSLKGAMLNMCPDPNGNVLLSDIRWQSDKLGNGILDINSYWKHATDGGIFVNEYKGKRVKYRKGILGALTITCSKKKIEIIEDIGLAAWAENDGKRLSYFKRID